MFFSRQSPGLSRAAHPAGLPAPDGMGKKQVEL